MSRIMKSARTLLIAFLGIITLISVLSGCEKLIGVTTIEMKEGQRDITVELGKFDYSDYTLIVNYDDGSFIEEELKEDYIPVEYQLQLYSEGTHEIIVKAHMRECSFTVHVERHTFPEDIKLGDIKAPYTGEPISASIEGVLPAGTKVTYSNGNSFTNVGSYDCYAILTCEGYITKTLNCKIDITPSDYDMSGVGFESDSFTYTYDGTIKSVELEGTLPIGVSVSYTIDDEIGNGAIKAGNYTVTAHFLGDPLNYNEIPSMSTELVIEKAIIDTAKVGEALKEMVSKKVTYDGLAHNLSFKGELPSGVSGYELKFYDKDDNQILNMVDASEYRIEIKLFIQDALNHELNIDTYSETYSIDKKVIISDNIYFDNLEVFYDGLPHTLNMTGEHVNELSIVYQVMNSDKLEFSECGTYTFKATIPEDSNYMFEEVVKEATLTILPIKSGFGDITDSRIMRKTYTGERYEWNFSFIPECLNYSYVFKNSNGEIIEEAINVGTYTYTVYFHNTNNYNDVPESCDYELVISEADQVIDEKCYKDYVFEYDGEMKEYPITKPTEDTTVTLEYVGRTSAPVDFGTYDVKLTFERANYLPTVRTAKIIISNAVIYDNLDKETLYASLIDKTFEYNGNAVDIDSLNNKMFVAKRISRGSEIPEGFYYYGESGNDMVIKVAIELFDSSMNKITSASELGTYKFNLVYSFADSFDDGYLKYEGGMYEFRIVKGNITLVYGEDFEYIDLNAEKNLGEVATNVSDRCKLSIVYKNGYDTLIGETSDYKIRYDGFYSRNSGGSVVGLIKADTYTITPTFISDYYNITVEGNITWVVKPFDINRVTLQASADSASTSTYGSYMPSLTINGTHYLVDNAWDTKNGTYNSPYINIDLKIEYKIYRLLYEYTDRTNPFYPKLVQSHYEMEKDERGNSHIKTYTSLFDVSDYYDLDAAYFFEFTVTNSAGESRTFYGPNYNSDALDEKYFSGYARYEYCVVRQRTHG